VLTALATLLVAVVSPARAASGAWAGYWHTSGAQILDANGAAVRIAGINCNWALTWTFPGDQKISQMWTATYTQAGEAVSAVNLSYNGTIAAAASVTIGFTGTYTSSNAAPAGFKVNGVACG
jgi:hypothetical protein